MLLYQPGQEPPWRNTTIRKPRIFYFTNPLGETLGSIYPEYSTEATPHLRGGKLGYRNLGYFTEADPMEKRWDPETQDIILY